MFKCTECGCEYEIKPDYCECGNDVFIEEKPKPAEQAQVKPEPKEAEVKPKSSIPYEDSKNISRSVPLQVFQKIEPFSLSIFLVCLILSFLIVFVWNPIREISSDADNTADATVKQTVNIPDINKIWNNTPPAAPSQPSSTKQTEEKPDIKIIIDKILPVPQQTVKVQQTQQPKQTPKVTQKPAMPKKTTSNAVSDEAKKAEAAKKAAEEAKQAEEAKKLAEEKKAAEEAQKAALAAQKAAEEKARKEAEKQEYANYKVNLRNTIGRKIDFTKVIGDGDCSVSFKIDSTGKLVSGAFVKQSTNMTLNDAVYAAFMSSRSYIAPPSGYNNETLKLNVSFYNGNFEISLQ